VKRGGASAADLKSASKIDLTAIKTMANATMFQAGFLAFNYNGPDVEAVINKLEAILKVAEPNSGHLILPK
jgi:hypothetical protein